MYFHLIGKEQSGMELSSVGSCIQFVQINRQVATVWTIVLFNLSTLSNDQKGTTLDAPGSEVFGMH